MVSLKKNLIKKHFRKKNFFQNKVQWRKNTRPSENNLTFGVDLSRNFDSKWLECRYGLHPNHKHYPGLAPFSEKETQFIRDVLNTHLSRTKAYVTARRNGHSLLYPYASTIRTLHNEKKIMKIAAAITDKVNMRAGIINTFINDSIHAMNGHFRCGHSVDYAYDLGIPYTFELRVFLTVETEVLSLFQAMPKNYYRSLLVGYMAGIKKLYDLIVAESYSST